MTPKRGDFILIPTPIARCDTSETSDPRRNREGPKSAAP
jgi:hypothetical protein